MYARLMLCVECGGNVIGLFIKSMVFLLEILYLGPLAIILELASGT